MFIFPFCVPGRWGGVRALALSSDVRFPEWGSAQNPPPPPLLIDIKIRKFSLYPLGNSKVIFAI
jgi:hypothetical protein